MPTCPKCGKDIDHLHAFVEETNKYKVRLEEGDYQGLDWGRSEAVEASATHTDFNCPECDHTLFKFEGEDSYYTAVEEFLKGTLHLEAEQQ